MQEWFEQKFGNSLKIQPPNSSSLVASNVIDSIDANYINAVYNIVPIWSESQIAVYMQTNPILFVPVQPITWLDDNQMNYTLVFFRDSSNQLDARLQVYRPSLAYSQSHATFSMQDFSGIFFQVKLNGIVQRIFAVENGHYTHRLYSGVNPNLGRGPVVTARRCAQDCFDRGPSIWEELACVFGCLVTSLSGGGGGGGSTPVIVTFVQHNRGIGINIFAKGDS